MMKRKTTISCLALLLACGISAGVGGALLNASADVVANNTNVTIKLNGGFTTTEDTTKTFSIADVVVSLPVGDYTLSHANVQAMFGSPVYEIAQESYRGKSGYIEVGTNAASGFVFSENATMGFEITSEGYYIVDATKAYDKVLPSGVLMGLFVDSDNDGVYDDGETMYKSGDVLPVAEGLTLSCYYDQDYYYSIINTNQVSLVKGWRTAEQETFFGSNQNVANVSARDLQPMMQKLVQIGSFAYRIMPGSPNWALQSLELPSTVTSIGGMAFTQAVRLKNISGLENIKSIGNNAFALANNTGTETVTYVLGDKISQVENGNFRGNGIYRIIFTGCDWAALETSNFFGGDSKTILGRYSSNQYLFDHGNMTVENPKIHVYVPFGQTAKWYPMAESGNYTVDGVNVEGNTPTLGTYAMKLGSNTSINVPLREMQTITFDLNGGTINGETKLANTYMDAGAKSVKLGSKELNLTSFDADLQQITTTNPAETNYSLLSAIQPANPEKENSIFAGWADETGYIWTGDDWANGGKTGYATATIKLKAIYKDNAKVTFVSNGSTYDEIDTFVDASLTEPAAPTAIAHYTFGGWYADEEYTTAWDFDSDVVQDTSLTLYAKWVASTYNARLYANGGYINTTDKVTLLGTDVYGMSFVYNSEEPLPTPEREGYIFKGWYESEDFSGDVVTVIASNKYGAPKYYANWEQEVVLAVNLINYILNGGINSTNNPITYTEGESVTLAEPTREGYIFKGWYESIDFEGTPMTEIPATTTGDLYLYAKWEENEINESPNNSSGDSSNGSGGSSIGSENTDKDKGCGSTIIGTSLGFVLLTLIVSVAFIIRKKNKTL